MGINAGGAPANESNTILDDQESGKGAGIRVTYNDTGLRNNVVGHNEASEGAGIRIALASPTLSYNTIADTAGGNSVGVFIPE